MNNMRQQNVHEVLQWASLFLEKHNREPKVAEILLLHHLQINKSQLLMRLRDIMPAASLIAYQQDLKAHADTGVPVQHLTGYETFYGRDFYVDKNVLIPRPETEELVLGTLERLTGNQAPLTVVDVGTGSGIIGITMKLELPSLDMHAVDISQPALTIAKRNADTLQANLSFEQSDFLTSWVDAGRTADVIISNPPYIPWDEEFTLADTVKNFDPSLALFAESNGLYAYQQIVKQATKVLSTRGLLAFEIGAQQGEAVKHIIQLQFPKSHVEICQDINAKDRMVFASIN